MKTIYISILFLAFSSISFSQGTVTSEKNSKGKEMLPQAKDLAIQYDMSPVFSFVGDAFSSNSSQNTASPFSQGVFVAKYFTSSTSAYRFKFGFNVSRVSNDSIVPYGNNQEYIVSRISAVNSVLLGFGKEWRRGHGRLQGVGGVEGLVQIGSGVPYQSLQYNLTVKQAVDTGVIAAGEERSLGVSKSIAFGMGVRAFAGIEYFIAPKISLGGEFGWGMGYQLQRSETTTESHSVETVSRVSSGERISRFVVNNEDGGSIFGGTATVHLTFHF